MCAFALVLAPLYLICARQESGSEKAGVARTKPEATPSLATVGDVKRETGRSLANLSAVPSDGASRPDSDLQSERILSGSVFSGAILLERFHISIEDLATGAALEADAATGTFQFGLPRSTFISSAVFAKVHDGFSDLFTGMVNVRESVVLNVENTSPRRTRGVVIVPGLTMNQRWFVHLSGQRGGEGQPLASSDFTAGERAEVVLREFTKDAGRYGDRLALIASSLSRPGHCHGHLLFKRYEDVELALTEGVTMETFELSFSLGSLNEPPAAVMLVSRDCPSARYLCDITGLEARSKTPLGGYIVEARTKGDKRLMGHLEFTGAAKPAVEWLHDEIGENSLDVNVRLVSADSAAVPKYSLVAELDKEGGTFASLHSTFSEAVTDAAGDALFADMFPWKYRIFIYGTDGPGTREQIGEVDLRVADSFTLSWDARRAIEISFSLPDDPSVGALSLDALECWVLGPNGDVSPTWQKIETWSPEGVRRIYFTAPAGFEGAPCVVRLGGLAGDSWMGQDRVSVSLERSVRRAIDISSISLRGFRAGAPCSVYSLGKKLPLPWTVSPVDFRGEISVSTPDSWYPLEVTLGSHSSSAEAGEVGNSVIVDL